MTTGEMRAETETQRDRRPLGLVLTANIVSATGSALSVLAVPWFVLQTTGSAGRAGVVAFCATLPMAVAALLGGPVIDRLGRRRTSVLADVVCAAAIGAVPLLYWAGALAFWHLCALTAVSGLCTAPGMTARTVMLPALAERAGTPLTRAAGLLDGVSRAARMVGAAAGGGLIVWLGPVPVLLLDAVSFAVSALLVGAAPLPDEPPAAEVPKAYGRELREGFRFVLRARLLLAVTLMVLVTNGLDQGWNTVLLPVLADRRLGGAVELGLLTGLFGGCALAGALLYGAVGDRFPRRTVFTVAFLLAGAPRFVVAALAPGTVPMALVMALDGLAAGTLNPILSVMMFGLVPEQLRSRVFGVTSALCLAAIPLGALACGYLTDGVGLTAALLSAGGVYLLATLCPVVFPSWRAMNAPAAVSSSVPSPRSGEPSER